MRLRPTQRAVVGACLTACGLGSVPHAVAGPNSFDLAGFVAVDVRAFVHEPAQAGQGGERVVPGLILQPELRYEWNDGADRLTAIPFVRLERQDSERSHLDMRELHWTHFGDDWDLLVGMGKVYWGVAESRHLVDVVNQVDQVEDPDEEDRLGQPMVRLSLFGERVPLEDASFTALVMPGFRPRTFPGSAGRLRGPLVVDGDRAEYQSGLDEGHPDVAARATFVVDEFDVGLSHFYGTGREPVLRLGVDGPGRPPVLVPRYELIHQSSLDAQATIEEWLLKLELMTRSGHDDRFVATVVGVEYSFYGLIGDGGDLGLIAEYLWDGRTAGAPPTSFDDDFFVGARIALNDVSSSELLVGGIVDRETQAAFLNLEASRRFGGRWTVELAARFFENIPRNDLLFGARRDDYVEVRIARYF